MKKAIKQPSNKPAKTTAPKNGKTDKPKSISAVPSADGGRYVEMHRRELHSAPYNPRVIAPVAAKRLRESLKRSGGMIQPPIWNKVTGLVVGGHKRLEQMDIIMGTDDYRLTVCVVELDSEAEEIETNIRLNSPMISGEFDVEMLDDLLGRPDIDLDRSGMDLGFLEELHANAGVDLPDWMLPPEDREANEALEEEGLNEMAEALDAVDEAEDEEARQAELDEIARRKAHFKIQEGFTHQSGLSFRVVCPSDATCAELLKLLGKAYTGDYVDGMALAETLGIKDKLQAILKAERPTKLKDFKLEDAPKRKKGKK